MTSVIWHRIVYDDQAHRYGDLDAGISFQKRLVAGRFSDLYEWPVTATAADHAGQRHPAAISTAHRHLHSDHYYSVVAAVEYALYGRSEEHTSELQSRENLVSRLLPE